MYLVHEAVHHARQFESEAHIFSTPLLPSPSASQFQGPPESSLTTPMNESLR